MYGVHEAASKMELTRALGGISVSAELPASITSEQTPAACLPYCFNHTRNTTKTACIYIINEKTVAFIPTQNQITVCLTATTMEPVEHFWLWPQLVQNRNCSHVYQQHTT